MRMKKRSLQFSGKGKLTVLGKNIEREVVPPKKFTLFLQQTLCFCKVSKRVRKKRRIFLLGKGISLCKKGRLFGCSNCKGHGAVNRQYNSVFESGRFVKWVQYFLVSPI